MAAKVGILKEHQQISDLPATYVKKSVAALLVRRLIAEKISRGVIRMLPVQPGREVPAVRCRPIPKPHIPGTLPPAEIEDLKFEDPVTDLGVLTRRRVLLLAAKEVAHGSTSRAALLTLPSQAV